MNAALALALVAAAFVAGRWHERRRLRKRPWVFSRDGWRISSAREGGL